MSRPPSRRRARLGVLAREVLEQPLDLGADAVDVLLTDAADKDQVGFARDDVFRHPVLFLVMLTAAAPAHIRCAGLPDGGGPVRAWAGPWAHDVRWWDHQMHRRCARWQVVIGEVACVVVVEAGFTIWFRVVDALGA